MTGARDIQQLETPIDVVHIEMSRRVFHPDIAVVRALRMKSLARDSAGLGSAARERNIAGRVLLTSRCVPADGEVLLVDDIVTTGATARESVRVLQSAGARVSAVLALAAA